MKSIERLYRKDDPNTGNKRELENPDDAIVIAHHTLRQEYYATNSLWTLITQSVGFFRYESEEYFCELTLK